MLLWFLELMDFAKATKKLITNSGGAKVSLISN